MTEVVNELNVIRQCGVARESLRAFITAIFLIALDPISYDDRLVIHDVLCNTVHE